MQKTEKSAKVQRRDKLKGRIEQVIKEIYGSIEFGMPAYAGWEFKIGSRMLRQKQVPQKN